MRTEKAVGSVAYATAPEDNPSDKHGTVQDMMDMWRVGRDQELNVSDCRYILRVAYTEMINGLQRNFRFLSVLGFSAVLMCTWEAVLLLVPPCLLS